MVREPSNTEIVITGANGLVGLEVLREFAKEWSDFDIKAFIRRDPDYEFPNVTYIRGRLPDEIPSNLFEKENVILIHFASQLKATSFEEYRHINVSGTSKLLDMAGSKLCMIFYGSSMSVYGQGPFEGVDEESETAPETELAKTRREAELLVEMKCKELNIPGYLLRPRFLFGKRDRATLPSLLKLSKKGFQIGNEKQSFSFIGVGDYARIISKLAMDTTGGECEPLNIAYKDAVELQDIMNHLNQNRETRRFALPVRLLLFFSTYLGALKPVKTMLELIGQNQIMNVEKLIKRTGTLMDDWDADKKLKELVEEYAGESSEAKH